MSGSVHRSQTMSLSVGTVELGSGPTLYTYLGDITGSIALCYVLIFFILKIIKGSIRSPNDEAGVYYRISA